MSDYNRRQAYTVQDMVATVLEEQETADSINSSTNGDGTNEPEFELVEFSETANCETNECREETPTFGPQLARARLGDRTTRYLEQWNQIYLDLRSSHQCSLAVNFLLELSKIDNFEIVWTDPNWQLVPIQLIKMWKGYEISCSDMALDLAACIQYVAAAQMRQEDPWNCTALRKPRFFHVQAIWYLAYLAHVFHQDCTIKLLDWATFLNYTEFFDSTHHLRPINQYVLDLFDCVCSYELEVPPPLLKETVTRLCNVPIGPI
eukprot:Platyproteum_vivax@DN3929_c0_g1_i1.p1